MSNYSFYISADGSPGLYSNDFGDIYHSVKGALTESIEKFVYPINFDMLLRYDEIKILDICYGIGYNTKSFLNFLKNNQKKFLKIKNSHASCSEPIHTDKILANNSDTNIGTIYTDKDLKNDSQESIESVYTNNIKSNHLHAQNKNFDKLFSSIYIKALDNDDILPYLSPLLKSKVKNNIEKYNLPDKSLEKYFKYKNMAKIKTNDEINYLFLTKLVNSVKNSPNADKILQIAAKNQDIFDKSFICLFKSLLYYPEYKSSLRRFISNLHNIYYRYISNRYKKAVKDLKIGDISFDLEIDDARTSVLRDNNTYNLIFLDAFSPSKCPCLWSYEFFNELFRILDTNGMIITYSTSALVRSAMREAGFFIGNSINTSGDVVGTVAVKNKSLIKFDLSEADLGLLNTRAGIFYRDKNLNGQNEAIINAHNEEVKSSDRISTTCYLKEVKRRNNV